MQRAILAALETRLGGDTIEDHRGYRAWLCVMLGELISAVSARPVDVMNAKMSAATATVFWFFDVPNGIEEVTGPDIQPRTSAMRWNSDLEPATPERPDCAMNRHSLRFRMALNASGNPMSAFGWSCDRQIQAILQQSRPSGRAAHHSGNARISPIHAIGSALTNVHR
jgi:hypothetical protein